MTTSYLNDLGIICALGQGRQAVAAGLLSGDTGGMQIRRRTPDEPPLTVGAVTAPLPAMPAGFAAAHSRNNALLLAAAHEIEASLRAVIARYGRHRVGVVVGTSTSGIDEAGQAIASWARTGALPPTYRYAQQEVAAPASFLAEWLDLAGPAYSLSTACTSSARALLSAHRLLQQGLCDAVICGGADTLCDLTLNGFQSLEAVSAARCNPFSVNRAGINIGEAAALFMMTREPGPIALLSGGASSDAHHISAPDPSGAGAQRAMRSALAAASLQPADIAYVNLHGTATRQNDAMESSAMRAVFGADIACSSTKPLTGHTLGAAGALEAAFCWLTLSDYNPEGRLPPHVWDGCPDPELSPLTLTDATSALRRSGPRRLMSNSFAFGGSNVSLIIGDAP